MNDLLLLLDEYLATRRVLGARLDRSGRLLTRFVAFLAQHEAPFITTKLALQWATEPRDAQPAQWSNRLGMARSFARYAHGVDGRHEVPPQGLLPHRYRRRQPYLFSVREIADLVAAAQRLSGHTGLRPLTYTAVLGVLAVTGMRVSEVLNLNRDDVDLAHGVLTVRNSKFGKSRQIPVHASTREALNAYAARRDQLCPTPATPAFFLAERGTRITQWALRWTFAKLSVQTGLRAPSTSHGHGPRLHDIRHTFAVNTLSRWYREGVDVERRIPRLATWLGHVKVGDTYWYLTASPDLLQLAARRLERSARRARP